MKVYIFDRVRLAEDRRASIKGRVVELFEEVARDVPALARVPRGEEARVSVGVSVGWAGTDEGFEGPATTSDLVAYIVRSSSDSVILRACRELGTSLDGVASPFGFTVGITASRRVTWVSEVYYEALGTSRTIGNVVFHELMHNMTGMTNAMHNQSGVRLGAETIAHETNLSDGDKALVRRRWPRRHSSRNVQYWWAPSHG